MLVVLNGKFENISFSVKYTQMQLGCSPNPLTTEKRRFVYYESSLSFYLHSDMLTEVSVIFSRCESDIKPVGLVIFYSLITWRSRISLRSNITRRKANRVGVMSVKDITP